MNSERAEDPGMPEYHGNPGKTLATQREAMGWTVEQVADQLKLAVRQVVALEAGDFAALPSPAVTRGFIRAYAKILKIDAAPLVAMVEMDTPAVADTSSVRRDTKPAKFNESSRFPMHGKRSSVPVGWIAAGVVVVLAAAAAWHFGLVPLGGNETAAPAAAHTGELAPPASATGAASEPVQSPNVPLISVPAQNNGEAPAPGANPQNTNPPGANPQGATMPQAPATGEAAPANGATATAGNVVVFGAPAAAQPAAAPAPAAAKPPVQAATETAVGPNALVFNVREDAWIQVKTASGKTLISRLVKGGSTETVQVDEPATMIVGNASAVNATLRGAAVQLPMLPGKTVARVSIK